MVPLVFALKGFLSHDECDHIVSSAEPHMKNSPVALMDKDQGKHASEWRTSTQTWLGNVHDIFGRPKDTTLQALKERTASLLKVDIEHQEHKVQVLRYRH